MLTIKLRRIRQRSRLETVRPTATCVTVGLTTLLAQGAVSPLTKLEYTMTLTQNEKGHVHRRVVLEVIQGARLAWIRTDTRLEVEHGHRG